MQTKNFIRGWARNWLQWFYKEQLLSIRKREDSFNSLFNLSLKLKNSIFEMLIIPQTLNINNSRTTRAKYISLHTIRKLIEYSLKNFQQRQCLLLPISRYWCPKVSRYYHPLSAVQGAKRLIKHHESIYPLDTACKCNVHKTFRKRPRHLLDILCTFN